jgi:hypothetical protein
LAGRHACKTKCDVAGETRLQKQRRAAHDGTEQGTMA